MIEWLDNLDITLLRAFLSGDLPGEVFADHVEEVAGAAMATSLRVTSDGGTMGMNPSRVGGTWAWVHVSSENSEVASASGVILPHEVGLPHISNNLVELWAAVRCLEALPEGWSGSLCTDSQTTLFRLRRPRVAKFKGIPKQLQERTAAAVERLGNLVVMLLEGHPTKAELDRGWGKRGEPVSPWNVYCDKLCGRECEKYQETGVNR